MRRELLSRSGGGGGEGGRIGICGTATSVPVYYGRDRSAFFFNAKMPRERCSRERGADSGAVDEDEDGAAWELAAGAVLLEGGF